MRRGEHERPRQDPLAVEAEPAWNGGSPLTVDECRERFSSVEPYTVGAEEELMLLSPVTLELAPVADHVHEALGDDVRFAREFRASQLEIVSPVCRDAAEVAEALCGARRSLVGAAAGTARPAAAGTHPLSSDWGEVSEGDRYATIENEYQWAARTSRVCGLHVHVAPGDADRGLAVYNALRTFLPEVAALAANSPFLDGEDTGLASVRATLCEALPRTGVPPVFSTWTEFVAYVDWGRRGRLFPDSTYCWWDLRLHPVHGTLELRVADSQTRVEDAAAIVAFVHCLVAWLGRRHDDGEALPVYPTHWIQENAWRAQRYGVRGQLVHLATGRSVATREQIGELLDRLEPTARALGCQAELAGARVLLAGNGADRQREVAGREGMVGLLDWLVRETEPGPNIGAATTRRCAR